MIWLMFIFLFTIHNLSYLSKQTWKPLISEGENEEFKEQLHMWMQKKWNMK